MASLTPKFAGTVDMKEVMSGIQFDLTVTGLRTAKARMWLGMKVVKLGIIIMGCQVNIEKEK
jgi:hypothetical protein